VTMVAGLRATAKAVEQPPEPNVGAPVLDPTDTLHVAAGFSPTLVPCARTRGIRPFLGRQICTQPPPAKRGRRTEELIATSRALTLLTNALEYAAPAKRRERESQRTAPQYSIDALEVSDRSVLATSISEAPIDFTLSATRKGSSQQRVSRG
jgi:hypothetical protein